MEPSILSTSNLPFIAVAVVIAIGFILINSYLTKTQKH